MLTKDSLTKALAAIIVAIAGYMASTMRDISETLVDMEVSLGRVVTTLEVHEKRLDTLEEYHRKPFK